MLNRDLNFWQYIIILLCIMRQTSELGELRILQSSPAGPVLFVCPHTAEEELFKSFLLPNLNLFAIPLCVGEGGARFSCFAGVDESLSD